MKHFLQNSLFCLLIFSMVAFSQGTEEPWALSWPLFENASSPHGILNGYGDWCVIDEGPHPGLDFAALPGDSVVAPTDQEMFSLGAKDFGASNGGCAMVIGPSVEGDPPYWGWSLQHLEIEYPQDPPFVYGSPLTGREVLAPCLQYIWPGGNPAPLHLHLAWAKCDVDPDYPYTDIVPIPPFNGYYNPFEYFSDNLSAYDEVQFKRVLYEGYKNTGAWFMPDGTETATQISALTDYILFQDIISGAIDIAVSPFSAFKGISDRDSAGVYSVSYEIFRENPHTLVYEPAAPDEGNFGERYLMEMRDEELQYGDSDGFRAIFLDGNLVSGATEDMGNPGENSYIITNSKAIDPSGWTIGWDNVYTAKGYTNSWADGICQGAWDTFLANEDISGAPVSNREAFFPDGRYAVEVTAVSHGSRESGSKMLPVDDLAGSTPETQGIIVDNHLPGVGAVIIYSSNSAGSPSSIDIKYMAKWTQKSDLDTPEYMEQLAYLEELREDLRFFQLLEQSDAVSVPEILQTYPGFQNELVPEGLVLNRAQSSVDITESRSNLSSLQATEEWDASAYIGQDPVEFLQEEIARIEDELDSRAGKRNLKVWQYGYIPYRGTSSADGETLNMLVIYTEPTMVENFSGIPLTDVIRMEGAIGYEILWDSQESGGMFVRDTPAGNAEHTGLVQEQMGSGFPSAPDAEYAVHYTYQGNLPMEFCGLLQVFIGADTPSTTKGPRDLAGHRIDNSQYSIPATRAGYESWANVGSYHSGYTPGIDASYIWGRPHWWFLNGIASAHVGSDVIAELEIASLGFEGEYSCIGDCFIQFGFWVYDDEDGEYGFDIAIVKPDGSVLHHVFTTRFSKGNPSTSSHYWWGGPRCGPFGGSEYTVSRDTRYFWMAGGNVSIHIDSLGASATSDAYVYCVDSWGGTKKFLVAAGSASTPDQSDLEGPPVAYAQICKIYKSGKALVMHANPGDNDFQYTIISPPGGGTDSIEEPSSAEQGNASVMVEKASFCNVLSNPVTESLDVVVSGGSGENWNLTVFDLSGRSVISESGVCTESNSVFNYGTAGLPSGIYLMRVEVGGVEEVQSISIVH